MIDFVDQKQAAFVKFNDGVEIPFILPKPSLVIKKSLFAFSLHKAGSSLLTNLLTEYFQKMKLSCIDLSQFAVRNGYDAVQIQEGSGSQLLMYQGYGYWGWRTYASVLDGFDFGKVRSIFLVRDPRDRLVSQYFSFSRSHQEPESGYASANFSLTRKKAQRLLIDNYAIDQNDWIISNWRAYHEHLDPMTTRVYRYEDVIFRKVEWLSDILNFFDLPCDEKIIESIVAQNDILPKNEDPNQHIRQVRPGNYKKHLSQGTCEQLNALFFDFLDRYSYLDSQSFGERLVFAEEGSSVSKLFGDKQV